VAWRLDTGDNFMKSGRLTARFNAAHNKPRPRVTTLALAAPARNYVAVTECFPCAV